MARAFLQPDGTILRYSVYRDSHAMASNSLTGETLAVFQFIRQETLRACRLDLCHCMWSTLGCSPLTSHPKEIAGNKESVCRQFWTQEILSFKWHPLRIHRILNSFAIYDLRRPRDDTHLLYD